MGSEIDSRVESVLGPPSPSQARGSRFHGLFDQLNNEFSSRFGRPLFVTGADNAEHAKLHPGGARDVRTHDMNDDERGFVKSRAPQLGLNLRDYSWVKQPFTTSNGYRITGPHFHIDADARRQAASGAPNITARAQSVLSGDGDRDIDSRVNSVLAQNAIPQARGAASPTPAILDHPIYSAALSEVMQQTGVGEQMARSFLASKPGKRQYPNLSLPARVSAQNTPAFGPTAPSLPVGSIPAAPMPEVSQAGQQALSGYIPGSIPNVEPATRELLPEDTASITATEQLRAPSGASLVSASAPGVDQPSPRPAITAAVKPQASTDVRLTLFDLDPKKSTPDEIKQKVLEQIGFSPEDARSVPFEIRTPNPTEHINTQTGELEFFIPKNEYELLKRQGDESKRKQAAQGIPAAQAILDGADIPVENKAIIQDFLTRLNQPIPEPPAPEQQKQVRPEDAGANRLIAALHDPNPQGKERPSFDRLVDLAASGVEHTMDAVSRPFVAASTTVAGLQRAMGAAIASLSGDRNAKQVLDQYGGANILKATWQALKEGKAPEGYEQPVAIVVREMAERGGIDPNSEAGQLLYHTTAALADPVMYGGVDIVAGEGLSAIKNLRKPISAIREEIAAADLATGLKTAATNKPGPPSPETARVAEAEPIAKVSEGSPAQPSSLREQQPITSAGVEPRASAEQRAARRVYEEAWEKAQKGSPESEVKPDDNNNAVTEPLWPESKTGAEAGKQVEPGTQAGGQKEIEGITLPEKAQAEAEFRRLSEEEFDNQARLNRIEPKALELSRARIASVEADRPDLAERHRRDAEPLNREVDKLRERQGVIRKRIEELQRSAPVDTAAHEAATSPQNKLPEPTEAQIEAGNYTKGHARIAGLDVSIENPAGSTRRPEWPALKSHYGYIKRTTGADAEQLDVFVKQGTPKDYDGPVFVVDQVGKGGKFDEHKVMLGFQTEAEAVKGYGENYTKGWKVGPIRKFESPAEFREWLKTADTTKPAAEPIIGTTLEKPSHAQSAVPESIANQSDASRSNPENIPSPYRATSQDDLATPKQTGAMRAVANEKGLNLEEEAMGRYKLRPEELNKKTAIEFISELKKAEARLPEVNQEALARYRELTDKGSPAKKPATQEPSPITGKETTAATERGTEIKAKYVLVEADSLVTSHDAAGNPNPNYPQEVQPRDRSRIASEEQVDNIARNIKPEFLAHSPKAGEGAPIIGHDMVVESGNGRSLAIRRAYDSIPESAAKYKKYLIDHAEEFGLEPAAIEKAKKPVLVRERLTPVDRAAFAREANESSVASMSAVEQARADSAKLTPELMSRFHPSDAGEILTGANREFIGRFIDEVVGPAERGKYLTADGQISQEGVTRVRNAVFAKAYASTPEGMTALEKLAESTDNNVRNITTAMLRKAGRFAALKDGIEQGHRYALDLSDDLGVAMKKLSDLREQGTAVGEYIRQGGLFGDELTPLQKDILSTFDKNKRSAKAVNEILDNYLIAVERAGDPKQQSFFSKVTPTKEMAYEAAVKEATGGKGKQAKLDDLFAQGEPAQTGGGSVSQVDTGRATGAGASQESAGGKQAENVSEPSKAESSKGLTRNFRAGYNNASMQFDSELQRDLYDIAAKERYQMKGGRNKTHNRDVGNLEALRRQQAQILDADESAVSKMAGKVYDDVRAQMKGVADGEARKLVDNLNQPKAPPASEAAKRAEILSRLKTRLATERGSGGPSTETVSDLARLATSYVREGSAGYRKWVAEMQNEFGLEYEKLKPHLLGAWKAAREALEAESKDQRKATFQKSLPSEAVEFPASTDTRAPKLQKELPGEQVDFSKATAPGRMKEQPLIKDTAPKATLAENVASVLNAPRAIMASADLSAPLRQGAILSLTEPKAGVAAARDMLRSISSKGFENVKLELEAHPRYGLAEDVGLHLSTREGARGLAGREEAFMTKLVGKVPVLKQSEQAYVAYLDRLRMDTFNKYADELVKAGLNPLQNKKEFEDIAKFINYATGRGDLGAMGNAIAPILNGMFFSPRYAISRVQILNPRTYMKMSPAARKIAMRKMAEFTGVVTATLSLAKLAGADVGLDPDSPDFLKIKIGNTRYDALAGFQQYMRFAFQTTKGFYNNATGGENERGKQPLDVALKFVRSKTAPVASFTWDAATGKDFENKKFSVSKGVAERIAPMIIKDAREAWQDQESGTANKVAATAAAFFGVGTQTYKQKGDSLSALDSMPEIKRLGIEAPKLERRKDESDAAFKKRQAQSDKALEKNKGEGDEDFQKRATATEEAIKKSVETLTGSKLYERLSDAQKRKAIYERIEKVKREQTGKFFPKSKKSGGLSISDIFN